MAILEQIPEPDLGKAGWNTRFKQVLDRVNLMPEIMFDALAQKLVPGSGIAINYNSQTKIFTISASGSAGLDTEALMDYLAANLVPGTGLDLTYDDEANQIVLINTVAGGGGGSTDAEIVRDTMATALVEGAGIDLTVNDPSDTITIATTITQYTDALARAAGRRVVALTDGATITPDADTTDVGKVTIAGNRTFAAPSGTPVAGQKLILRIKQDATGSRVPTWNAIYRFPGGSAPTLTTTASKTDYLGFIYNADDTKWDNVAVTKNL